MKNSVYVAVVLALRESYAQQGAWKSFTGRTETAATNKAIAARDKWERAGSGPYEIFVGQLTKKVKVPARYTLAPL